MRSDKYAVQNRVVVEQEKAEEDRGAYLHPKAYGVSEDNSESAKHKLKILKNPTESTPLSEEMEK